MEKIKIIYTDDEVNEEFEKQLKSLLDLYQLEITGSGYNFKTNERDLTYEFERV